MVETDTWRPSPAEFTRLKPARLDVRDGLEGRGVEHHDAAVVGRDEARRLGGVLGGRSLLRLVVMIVVIVSIGGRLGRGRRGRRGLVGGIGRAAGEGEQEHAGTRGEGGALQSGVSHGESGAWPASLVKSWM
ncbi:hypothetical protein GCM10025876_20120 [Demequina litorisediminis]|uniref:Uncharacterized protein n=1 Tax=Demequina litorisediminis TaxID=1849022 RepID=A0ABQ6IGE8_9MICO|nr:hypothetical protein GCM10025876_20120 [Demequina litorisediminis]